MDKSRLGAVADGAAGTAAAKDVKSLQNSYGYDYNGNLISDSGKNMTAAYNHLNLPREIIEQATGADPGGAIQWVYDATGRKLKKISPDGHILYHDGIEKAGGGIFDYHAEGRVPTSREHVAFYPGNPGTTPPVEDEWYYEFLRWYKFLPISPAPFPACWFKFPGTDGSEPKTGIRERRRKIVSVVNGPRGGEGPCVLATGFSQIIPGIACRTSEIFPLF